MALVDLNDPGPAPGQLVIDSSLLLASARATITPERLLRIALSDGWVNRLSIARLPLGYCLPCCKNVIT